MNEFPLGDSQIVNSVEVEKVWLFARTTLSAYPAMQQNAEFRHYLDSAVQQLVLQVTSWCAAGRIPDVIKTHTFAKPATVWQMFKDLHMPKWFVARWPVRYVEETVNEVVNHYFVCPHLVTDPQGTHVKFMVTGTRHAGRL